MHKLAQETSEDSLLELVTQLAAIFATDQNGKAIYSDCVDRAVALLASAQLREKALVEALEKAIPRLAEHLRMMRSENDHRAPVATNDLADARAALDAAITANKQIKE
jgi:acyl-CoA hydrolase